MKDPDEKNYEPFKVEGGQTLAFKPDKNEYVPVNDAREEMQRDSEKYATSKEHRRAFYQQKINLIELSGTSGDQKDELLQDLRQSELEEEANLNPENPPNPRPIPGGVGYGAFYKDGSLKFQNSSVLYYYIVTVPDIGDARNKWLYLTSTNRSPKGVEAYISYREQNEPKFTVFDWSKKGDARWSLSRPYSLLIDYLLPYESEGIKYQTINVANSTRRVIGTTWVNEVMLYNRTTQAYDLVYSNEYDLPSIEESKYLWWGPIVETFAPFPYSTNDIGFFDAQLLQDSASPTLLTAQLTDLRKDHANHPGFKLVFDRPNDSFIVRWDA